MTSEKSFYYKGMKVNSFGISIFSGNRKSRAKKENRKRTFYNISFSSPFNKNSPKNLLLIYDIPEGKKKERDWFRRQLIKFDYVMIQKSVWVGPSPLPSAFLDYLKEIKIKDNFKTFKLAKSFTEKPQ